MFAHISSEESSSLDDFSQELVLEDIIILRAELLCRLSKGSETPELAIALPTDQEENK